ncbi:hypothetical protein [Winogradskyella psychrotolerans]|uniref:hypothetical protein n=1 Tax=Winogradskyella psychrotolerans TaxID=1344585 RepID=UPI001C065F77|nr:hypothetical protein [Winogradskyella psychrotolerans]MBU2927548.1 hypothetical protein [Winogradskyella psychrotolerans]
MPFAESMMSTLRSNKVIMLNKSKRFRKTLGGYDKQRKTEYNFPKATPEHLEQLRQKLKKENQILWGKVISVSLLCLGSLLWIFWS